MHEAVAAVVAVAAVAVAVAAAADEAHLEAAAAAARLRSADRAAVRVLPLDRLLGPPSDRRVAVDHHLSADPAVAAGMVPVHPNGPRVADSAEVVHDHRNDLQWGRVADSVVVPIARVVRELAIAQVDVLHPAIWVTFSACPAGAAVHGHRNCPVAEARAQLRVVPAAAVACSVPAVGIVPAAGV